MSTQLNITNANEILFRPSGMADIMSGTGKGWDVDNSLTCKKKLIKMFREIRYNRYYFFTNKYTEKGIKMEEDAITLYSRVKKLPLFKNSERLTNKFFSGEFDLKHGNTTIDIKCSWSLDSFPHPMVDKADEAYRLQGNCYMDLTGATNHIVAYCLVNAPANLITREKEKMHYEMNCPDLEDPKYIAQMETIERNMIFDMEQFKNDNPRFDIHSKDWVYDIPMKERVVEFHFEKDSALIGKMKDRVEECREWMNAKLFKVNESAETL